MRIISSFHDYYDSARYFGGVPDSNVNFVRETGESKELQDFPISLRLASYSYYNSFKHDSVNAILVGFCDKIYTCFTDYKMYSYGDISPLSSQKKGRSVDFYNNQLKYGAKVLEQEIRKNQNYLKSFFISERIPYWKIVPNDYDRKYSFTSLPRLNDIEFWKVFVPPLAYQEIEMYMNSVLVSQQQPSQIVDNKTILECKGFDNKISFRHPVKIKE